jgi:hypothetical protein
LLWLVVVPAIPLPRAIAILQEGHGEVSRRSAFFTAVPIFQTRDSVSVLVSSVSQKLVTVLYHFRSFVSLS